MINQTGVRASYTACLIGNTSRVVTQDMCEPILGGGNAQEQRLESDEQGLFAVSAVLNLTTQQEADMLI